MITHSVRWISNTHLVEDEYGYFVPKVIITGRYFIRGGEWKAKEGNKKNDGVIDSGHFV